MLTLETLRKSLGGKISNGQLLCPGPGHSAKDESLSIKLDPGAPDGMLVHSFADDDPIVCKDYIREKCGLPPFKPKGNGHVRRRTDEEIERALKAAIMRPSASKSNVVARYDYTGEAGVLLYQVERLEPKSFRQRRPDGKGGWIYNLGGVRRVPYRWPELLEYPDGTIFLCEGEKDADRIASLGHCATTATGGKWADECIKALADRDVIILQDADNPGTAKALKTATALHGTAKTIRIVRLPGLTGHSNNKDVSDWLDADPHRAGKLVDACFDVPLWEPSGDRAGNETEGKTEDSTEGKAEAKTAKREEAQAAPNPLIFIDLTQWQNQHVPERSWVVRDRIPLNNVTLLSGEGAVGKTILALQLCVATPLARDWLKALPEPGPVIAVCCEDDADELHRRLDAIVRYYGVSFADLADLHLVSLAGHDALLATPRRDGLLQPTGMFKQLSEAARDLKPKLILVDNSADVFGGNENDRAQVRQFIGMLHGLAMVANAGALLTSHPSLTGISTGTGLSGSTAWNASVRSRLYLKRATTAKDEEPDPNLRVLEVMKNNHGPIGETIMLRWEDGLFLPVPASGSLEKLAREQKLDELFLMLLGRCNGQGRVVNDKKTSNTYAPNRFVDEPEAKADHVNKRELADAMERLFRAGKIHVVPYGFPSRGWTRLEHK
jgi:RecA-family ATPase